jgi:hypothetical protein
VRTLPALRLTREAARRLRHGGTGRVHSCYTRTVNLRLDGDEATAWVSLHGPGVIPSPFGIACATPALGELVGAPVRVEGGVVAIDGALRVLLPGATVVETRLPDRAPRPPADAGPPSALPTDRLAALGEATACGDQGGCVAAARGLVGRGPGLTPAGDDCLVGWLAALHTAGARGAALLTAVGPAVLAAARAGTSALSRAWLAAAVAGVVAEPVSAFVASPDAAHRVALLALGATSGADCLGGYLLGRRALP